MLALFALLVGCADGVKLVQEQENGGVVVYPFKEGQGPLLSSFRAEALAVIRRKCGDRSYDILREGEAKGRARVVSPIEGQEEVIQERRWGIQFQCR
ncbi:MAG: hypothetical protein NNA22_05260 [Nitrospira sp.]|nr:hypothetical protein [Nitrospira sp.]